jgi:hypothetical protein
MKKTLPSLMIFSFKGKARRKEDVMTERKSRRVPSSQVFSDFWF